MFSYGHSDTCQGLYLAQVLLKSEGLKLGGVRVRVQFLSYSVKSEELALKLEWVNKDARTI